MRTESALRFGTSDAAARYLNEKPWPSFHLDGLKGRGGDPKHVSAVRHRAQPNRETSLPDEKWLKLYRQLGGEAITLGSDAHAPKDVGCAIAKQQALLKDCGFGRFCTFERQKPVWHEL
jgi:hypothetical protein